MNDRDLRARLWRLYLLPIAIVSLGGGYWIGDALLADPDHTASTTTPAAQIVEVQPSASESQAAKAAPQRSRVGVQSANRSRRVDTRALALSRLALGRDFWVEGDLKSAYLAYVGAVELYPSAETHAALGGLYFRIAARDEAYIQFRKAVELDPYNADLLLDLANAEHMRTALGYEWNAVQRAKEIDPDIQIARDESGFYFRDENDPKAFTSSGSYTMRRIP